MRRIRPAAASLLSILALAGGFAAGCGGEDLASDEVPVTPPELTVPTGSDDDALAAEADDETSRTDTTPDDTETTADEDTGTAASGSAAGSTSGTAGSTAGTPSTGGSAAPAPGGGTTAAPAPQATPNTGGSAAPGTQATPQPDQGTGGANADDFSEFCQQNPGAC